VPPLGEATKTFYSTIMIDPASIEVAFATAQRAIGGIKQAVAMGKDIKSLYVQFGTFFENSDKIHTANCLGEIKGMTNGQIRSKSLQIAMQSKALRQAEKDLKEMLIWSGNKDVWDEFQTDILKKLKAKYFVSRTIINWHKNSQSILEINSLVIHPSCFYWEEE
jgi:hypothetical protein